MALLFAVAAPATAQSDDSHENEALTATGIAGEILDTAVEHCRRGEREQALSMFKAIRDQLDPPPGIQRVLTSLEATGCHPSLLTEVRGLRVQIGTGWDSNVSQGITARSLSLGTAGNTVEFELDSSYRPRSSGFVQGAVDYSLPLPWAGLQARVSLAHRHNHTEPAFDLSTASGALSREFKLGDSALRTQIEHTQVRLGSKNFQRTEGAGLQWLGSRPEGAWLAHVLATKVDYLTQPTQNARQYEAGLLLEKRVSTATSLYGSMALQYDHAVGMRAGGDRKGVQLRAGALVLAYGWQWRPQVVHTRWESADLFAPGLIDLRRNNRLNHLVLQAEKPISQQTSLLFEWNGRWASDTIPLYRYKAHTITATLAYRF